MSDRYIWQLRAMREDIAEMYPSRKGRDFVGIRDIAMQVSGVFLGFALGLAVASALFAIAMLLGS